MDDEVEIDFILCKQHELCPDSPLAGADGFASGYLYVARTELSMRQALALLCPIGGKECTDAVAESIKSSFNIENEESEREFDAFLSSGSSPFLLTSSEKLLWLTAECSIRAAVPVTVPSATAWYSLVSCTASQFPWGTKWSERPDGMALSKGKAADDSIGDVIVSVHDAWPLPNGVVGLYDNVSEVIIISEAERHRLRSVLKSRRDLVGDDRLRGMQQDNSYGWEDIFELGWSTAGPNAYLDQDLAASYIVDHLDLVRRQWYTIPADVTGVRLVFSLPGDS